LFFGSIKYLWSTISRSYRIVTAAQSEWSRDENESES
jgi:hypothetical protein